MKKIIVAGAGVKALSQLTREVIACIRDADAVYFLVNESVTKEWIVQNNKNAIDLDDTYFSDSNRDRCYDNIVSKVISGANEYNNICLVIYGHPCCFVAPVLRLSQKLKNNKNIELSILPAVSALDCLFADLHIDMGIPGCCSYEARYFLNHTPKFDVGSHLILWQVGIIAKTDHDTQYDNSPFILALQELLLKYYIPEHQLIIYEAAQFPFARPQIKTIYLKDLAHQELNSLSTLYVKPLVDNLPGNV